VPQIFIGSKFIGGNDNLQVCIVLSAGRQQVNKCVCCAPQFVQDLCQAGQLSALVKSSQEDVLPPWLGEVLAGCKTSVSDKQATAADLDERLSGLERTPLSPAAAFVRSTIMKTKLGNLSALSNGFFVSASCCTFVITHFQLRSCSLQV
jgi:hypothetical protein